jgi:hypothetical protein
MTGPLGRKNLPVHMGIVKDIFDFYFDRGVPDMF